MKNSSWLFVIIVLAAMVVLNPSLDKHRTKINEKVKGDKPLVGAIGGGKLLGVLTTYNNYYLFSTTDIEGEKISFGILGIVVVEDIDNL